MKMAFLVATALLTACQNDPSTPRPEIRGRVHNLSTVDLASVTIHLNESLEFGPVRAAETTNYKRTRGGISLYGVSVSFEGRQYHQGYQIDFIGDAPYREGDYTALVTFNAELGRVSVDLGGDSTAAQRLKTSK